jgi:hypothetical protein
MMENIDPIDKWPWIMVGGRALLFLLFQSLLAAFMLFFTSTEVWKAGAAYWTVSVALTNIVCLLLLVHLFNKENRDFWQVFRIEKHTILKDLPVFVGCLLLLGPIAMIPNFVLANALFGDIQIALQLFLLPLPRWVIYCFALVVFPLTQGVVELAFYFLYCMPEIEKKTHNPELAYCLSCLFLGLQHSMIPFLPNGSFILWRALMFLPFSFFVGAILKWRPRMLPYLAFVHVAMDFSVGVMYITGT